MRKYIGFLSLFLLIILGGRVQAYGDTFDNAIDYYNSYGNNTVFKPTTVVNGSIYCATKGNASSATTKYRTIGWKLRIKSDSGDTIQTLYFELGGKFLARIDKRTSGGYEYDLYKISLYSLKQRLSDKSLSALDKGECSIILDACMVVVKNGLAGGSIDDNGGKVGKVYTTYSGIVAAENWSESAKVALKTYFGKKVIGLFYNVYVQKTQGIAKATGGGKYCYGTRVSVSAQAEDYYSFDRWDSSGNNSTIGNGSLDPGEKSYRSKSVSFYVNGDSSWTAYARVKSVTVYFHRNSYDNDPEKKAQGFTCPSMGQAFIQSEWTKTGYQLEGWAFSKTATEADFSIGFVPTTEWIAGQAEVINLYAVWKPNQYWVYFEGKKVCQINPLQVSYVDVLIMPENGEFEGWGLDISAAKADYPSKSQLSVTDIVTGLGLENTNDASIVFYAIWASFPVITARDMYYSLEYAQSGLITAQELGGHANAYDSVDGNIEFGKGFEINNYQSTDFTSLTEEAVLPITFEAVNSAGKRVKETVNIHIVDSSVRQGTEGFGRLRFISKKYIKQKTGGLSENSCWLKIPEYYELILKIK